MGAENESLVFMQAIEQRTEMTTWKPFTFACAYLNSRSVENLSDENEWLAYLLLLQKSPVKFFMSENCPCGFLHKHVKDPSS